MLFNLGDLIIILVVLGILLIFRRMNMANRIPPQFKKMMDQSRDDLEGFIRDRSVALKNLSIELEAQQKVVQALFKKSESTSVYIQQFFSRIEKVEVSITKYEELLPQLVRMTEHVEKNLVRIHDESEYIDTVGKRLKDSQEKLQELQGSLGNIYDSFETANSLRLKEIETRFSASVEVKSQELTGIVDDSEQRMRALEVSLQDMSKNLEDQTESFVASFHHDVEVVHQQTLQEVKETTDQILKDGEMQLNQKTDVFTQSQTTHEAELQRISVQIDKKISDSNHIHQELVNLLQSMTESMSLANEEQQKIFTTVAGEIENRLDRKQLAVESSVQRFIEKYATLVNQTRQSLEAEQKQIFEKTEGAQKQMEATLARVLSESLHALNAQKDGFSAFLQDCEHRSVQLVSDAGTSLDQLAQQGRVLETESLVSLTQNIDERITAVKRDVEASTEALAYESKVAFNAHKIELQNFAQGMEDRFGKISDTFRSSEAEIEQRLLVMQENAQELAKNYYNRLVDAGDQSILNAQGVVEKKIDELNSSLEGSTLHVRKEFEQFSRQSNEYQVLLRERTAEAETIFQNAEQKLTDLEKDQREHLIGDIAAMREELARYRQEIETDVHSSEEQTTLLNKRIAHLHGILQDGEGKIHQDIQQYLSTGHQRLIAVVEKGIVESEQNVLIGIEQRLTGYEQDFTYRISYLEELPDTIDQFNTSIRANIKQAESLAHTDITQLAENMKTDQQAFETDFLRWQTSLRNSANVLRDELEDFRLSVEKSLGEREENISEEVSQRLHDFQETMKKKLEQSITHSIQSLGEAESRQKKEVEQLSQRFTGDLLQKIQQFREETNQQIAICEQGMQEAQTELQKRSAEVQTQTVLVQKEFERSLQNLSAAMEQKINERIHQRKEETDALVDSFTQQVFTQVQNYQQESGQLFQTVNERMIQFEQQYLDSEQRLTEKNIAIFDDLEQKKKVFSEELTTLVSSTTEQFTEARKRFLSRVENDVQAIEDSLGRLEKQQKNILSQMPLLNRLENIRGELKESIAHYKKEFEQLEGERQWLREVEGQILNMKRVSKETEKDLARVLAEKRRLDALEGNFSNLMVLSRSVEQKLEDVTEKDDRLQAIQVLLRDIDNLQKKTEGQLARLEEKQDVVTSTIQAVDVNFSQLRRIEQEIKQVSEKLTLLPDKVQTLGSEITKLQESRGETLQAMQSLQAMQTNIQDLEQRMDQLQKAREWLASAETRFEHLGKEIDDQLRSLGQLVKGKLPEVGEKLQTGVPQSDTRRTVAQLARQGWNAEEIARVTKISRGEVELILEMALHE